VRWNRSACARSIAGRLGLGGCPPGGLGLRHGGGTAGSFTDRWGISCRGSNDSLLG
jgi:hypothetical protein